MYTYVYGARGTMGTHPVLVGDASMRLRTNAQGTNRQLLRSSEYSIDY